jgi:hypothetical protein
MPRKTITLEVDSENEGLLRRYAEFVEEMNDLAATAPEGSVLEVCEDAVVERGREHQRRLLERAVASRVEAVEKR